MLSLQRMFAKHRMNDHGISPVIGTILMVAATVIIGGAVYAAVTAYNGKSAKPPTDASFKAQAMDSDGNGLDDSIKVTYLSGPNNLAASVKVAYASNGTAVSGGEITKAPPASWNAGDYAAFNPTGAGTYYVTVALGGTTLLDQSVQVQE